MFMIEDIIGLASRKPDNCSRIPYSTSALAKLKLFMGFEIEDTRHCMGHGGERVAVPTTVSPVNSSFGA
jgi:hypothetical protein